MQYEQRSIIDIVEEAYSTYGAYVNFNRFMPNVLDGLKPSYRKSIYATMCVCKDQLANVGSVLGEVVKYYNHGPEYLTPVLCKLAKYGILRDDGANGSYFIYGENVRHAASRYLETGVSPFWYKLFSKLINYVPYELSDKGHNEPLYIPTPIPLGLTFGYNAMSCGANTEIPPFTAKSLLDALVNDDPKRLKMSFGLELIPELSNLDGIWKKGAGKLMFRYPWRIYDENGIQGILITGNPIYTQPAWGLQREGFDFTLDSLVEKNQVEVLELEKDGELRRTLIKIKKNVDINELAQYVDATVTGYKLVKLSTYLTNHNGKKTVTRLSLRAWLKICFSNYINLLETYKKSNIDNLIRQRTILEWLPKIAKLIIDDTSITNEQICKKLGIEDWIVQEVVKKPISTLRKSSDTSQQIENINNRIKEFENFNSEKFTVDIINEIPE